MSAITYETHRETQSQTKPYIGVLEQRRIFMLEDNLVNQMLALKLLRGAGADVVFERWGTHTLTKLRRAGDVDIILLDLMISDTISGFDIFDAIRTLREFDRTPIAAVSAADPYTTIPQLRARGFSGFISKPLQRATFAPMIARLIAGEQLWSVDYGVLV